MSSTGRMQAHDLRVALDLPPVDRISLGRVLVALDLIMVTASTGLVLLATLLVPDPLLDGDVRVLAGTMLLLVVPILAAVGLYQRRKCAIASVEISRVGRACAFFSLVMLLALQAADSIAPYTTSVLAAGTTFLALVLGRGAFRHWLKGSRLAGRFLTPVALVGERDAVRMFALRLGANPDAGYRAVVHVDVDPTPLVDLTDSGHELPRVGHIGEDLALLVDHGVESAVLLTDHLEADELNTMVRRLERRFAHVQIVTTLAGVSHARLVPTPLIGEMTFYLEPFQASPWQRVAKRSLDVVLAGLLLLLASPVLAVLAALIHLTDRGPVLYSQERVGRDGELIRIWKLRSMVVDAEARLAELAEDNQRGGPLFKAAHDPRITPVGRFIRATSLDELPQLWSILVGDMSLVGPRPALPAEVEDFDPEHQRRHEVKPGLTGLWQVEDRDHPDFERYRRHDVFYVENWSLSLDMAIILQTAVTVAMRPLRSVLGDHDDDVLT